MADNNPFDQFDAQPKSAISGNPFDQFDSAKPLTPDQINAHLNAIDSGPDFNNVQSAVTSTAPMTREGPPRTTAEDFARAQLMMTRDLAHGAGSLPGLVHDYLIEKPYNAAAQALGSDSRLAPASQQIDYLLQKAGIPTEDPGLQPQNRAEQVYGAINRSVGSAATGIGIGQGIARASNPTIAAIGSTLASNQGAQLLAGGSAGASADIARQSGAGPTGQLIAGLAGGLAPGASSLLATGATQAAARALRPDAAQRLLVQKALANDIPVNAAQANGGQFAKYLDSATGIIPLSGGKAGQQATQEAFNRQLGQTMGIDTPKLTQQAFNAGAQRLGKAYDTVFSRNNLPVDQSLQNSFSQVLDRSASADPSIQSMIKGYWDRVTKGLQVDPNGNVYLPGSRFKEIDSDMGGDLTQGGATANYIGPLRQVFRDAMANNMSPNDKALLDLTNKQYAAMKTLEPLVAKSTTGDISPAGLLGAVTKNAASKTAMARGNRGDLGDLAQIGQMIKEPPQSGTEPRMMIRNLLAGIGSAGGALAGGHVLGPLNTLGAGALTLAGSRGIQNILQNPELVRLMAGGQANYQNALNRLGTTALPTAQGIQASQ